MVKNGPLEFSKNANGLAKKENESKSTNYKRLENNVKAMSLVQKGIPDSEVNRILAYSSAKEIWDTLELAYEGIFDVRRSKIDMLMS